MTSRRIFAAFTAAVQAGTVLAVMTAASPAGATTLSTYYKTLMAVRKCELTVEEEDMAKLHEAIENKVTNIEATSDTINGIFESIATEIGDDTAQFCTDYSATALVVIQDLSSS